jgi:PPP4R2
MDNPEEVMQILERFNVSKNPEITAQLEEYITFVARTGDSVYAWSLVKNLFREKLVTVITEFYNETPTKGETRVEGSNIQPVDAILLFLFQNCLSIPMWIPSTMKL